ncbi:MAG: S-layer homology domain-containing protein [Pseudomonadota bacterium]
MNRKLRITLTLCLILTMLLSIPVFAAGGLTLDKTSYTANEAGKVTVTGLSDAQIEDGAFLAIEEKGTRLENATVEVYVMDLPSDNTYEFAAPEALGTYEMLLLDSENTLLASKTFTVVSQTAVKGDITLSKAEVKLKEPMTVKVEGLTAQQIENGAWLGIEKYDTKINNTIVETYISDLPTDNTYKFTAPESFGKYEIRVFSDINVDDYSTVLFGKSEFTVVSSKAKAGDIVLSKSTVAPEEKMTVTVKNLTQGEIDMGAWLAISLSNEKLENSIVETYISGLPVGNIYEFNAPSDPGTYEIRVFCSGNMQADEYEYGRFGTVQFVVSGEPAASSGLVAGYENLSGWAVPEVNAAKEENLVTEKVMVNFPENITREEFCELAVLLYEKMTGKQAAAVAVNPFSDTKNPQVLKAYNLKIVNGTTPSTFSPNNKVTRQDISAMVLRTLQAAKPELVTADFVKTAAFKGTFADKAQISNYALDAVKFMNANGVVNGSGNNILPKGNTTREQAILMILRAYNAFK